MPRDAGGWNSGCFPEGWHSTWSSQAALPGLNMDDPVDDPMDDPKATEPEPKVLGPSQPRESSGILWKHCQPWILIPSSSGESKLEQSLYRHHQGPNNTIWEYFPLCVFPLSISRFYPLVSLSRFYPLLVSLSRFYPFVSLSRFYPLVSLHYGKGSSLFLCINKYILYQR